MKHILTAVSSASSVEAPKWGNKIALLWFQSTSSGKSLIYLPSPFTDGGFVPLVILSSLMILTTIWKWVATTHLALLMVGVALWSWANLIQTQVIQWSVALITRQRVNRANCVVSSSSLQASFHPTRSQNKVNVNTSYFDVVTRDKANTIVCLTAKIKKCG